MNHHISVVNHRGLIAFIALSSSLAFSIFCSVQAGEPNSPVKLETPFLVLTVFPERGGFEILDKPAQVTWQSNPFQARLGEATLKVGGQSRRISLAVGEMRLAGNTLTATFTPLTNQPQAKLRVTFTALKDGRTLETAYSADPSLTVESIRLLDEALWVTDRNQGSIVVPVREGLLVPADSGLAFSHRFDTFAYEGCHMEMLGVAKNGSTVLLTWHDPYVAAELRSALTNNIAPPARQILSPSLVLRQSAKSFRMQFCGPGDFLTLGQAYRQVAKDKGWLVTWDEKLIDHPKDAQLFGAINFKLWSALSRQMNEESTQEVSKRVNWTFNEAAQVAEHLRQDLKLDRVLFILGGWIHRGYDNQHPDVLPAAPECGGNEGLADCSRRVRQLGYLFCLHDNYQDIYRDSPSWQEDLIMKNRDGSLTQGGKWAGGRAYLTCSQKALELAQRPQNLPAIKKLTEADVYFIDTTYASGLQECFDPHHPLTRWDDMKWKQALSDYSRKVFGMFSSECGKEWAIPHSDFFEGLTGVSGHFYHDNALLGKVGGVVVPLFEVVYRDTIALYGKYGYDFSKSAEYVLHHILIGRPLHYHNLPSHLYWQQPARPAPVKPDQPMAPDPAVFTRAENGWASELHPVDRFVKNTYEILSPLNEITARMRLTQHQFLSADRKVQRTVFGEGEGAVAVVINAGAKPYQHQSKLGGLVELPPYGFVIESATFVAWHAVTWNGVRYDSPVFFTLRSQDGQAINRSKSVRIYHGFGDDRLKLTRSEGTAIELQVPRELGVVKK